MKIPNFTLQEMLSHVDRYAVFRGVRNDDQKQVLIRTTVSDHPLPFEIARLKHEYEITQLLKGRPRIIEPYALTPYQQGRIALVMENVEGMLLHQLIRSQKIDTETGLRIAIEIAKAIRDIHRANVIHKDLQPQNIMVTPVTNAIKVIDFGLSTRLEREIISAKAPEYIEGSLEYISPEQTGRINREVTYRTDFYSLGVLLYEIFTGRLPFTTPIPLDLIHQHIAKEPLPPHQIDPEIPIMITEIILKLLEKNAEDRYKSAGGLIYDLEEALQQFEKTHAIANFPLCRQDVQEHLFIPEKLYGREKHLETLFKRFEQAASGKPQLVLVSGESGIGKSVLIQEIQRPLSKMGGFFITGKCDQFKQNIFYHAIIQSIQQLIQHILSETPASIAEWRRKILNAMGPNGQVIIDVVPNVEAIIGKQQPLPQLPPKETRDRFHYYFQAFIQVFIAKEHPLIVFLDDLQWIDLASLRLLTSLLTDPTAEHLLIFGAYHGQKNLTGPFLIAAIEEMKQRAPHMIEIELQPLHHYHIAQLLAVTFNSPLEQVDAPARVIKEKTEGNPFFMKELLKTLLVHRAIYFHSPSQLWEWNLSEIQSMAATANVLELLEKEMTNTPKETQELLKVAAVLGNVFSLQTLAHVTNRKTPDVARLLREPVEKEMILPIEEKYEFFSEYDPNFAAVFGYEDIDLHFSFAHDRVQQVAYGLILVGEEKKIHYQVGKRLLETTPQDKIEESIFTILYHLNDGADLVNDREERLYYSRLNLMGAKKAKNASSYQSALEFAEKGLTYLDAEQKKEHYDLWKDLSAELAACYYHNGNLQQAKEQFEDTLKRVKTVEEKIKILILWNRLYQMKRDYRQAIETAYQALDLLHYTLPRRISPFLLWKELMHVRWFLFRNPPKTIRTLPQMTNQRMLLIAELLYCILPPAFVIDEPKFFLIGLRLVLLVKYGISPFSLLGFSSLGMTIPWLTKSYRPSLNLGELSLELARKYDYRTTEPVSLFAYASFLADQQYSLRKCIALETEGHEKAIVFGDFMWAGYSIYQICWLSLYAGEPIGRLLKATQKSYVFNERFENELTLATSKVLLLHCRALLGQSPSPQTISDQDFHTESEWASNRKKGDDFAALVICLCEANFCFLQGEHQRAKKWIERSKEVLPLRVNFQVWVQTHYLECLVLAALYPRLSANEQQKCRKTFRKNLNLLEEWAVDPVKNKCHFYPLARAEYDRIFHPKEDAVDSYLQAIKMARENHFIQDEAIANELMAQYQREKGRDKIADIFLRKAVLAYQEWGAHAKVNQLESLYPHLFPAIETETVTTTQVQKGEMDLMSVIDASRVMAGELVVDRLLARLMEIVVTTAGATKAFLLLTTEEGKLSVVTEWDEVKQQAVLLPSLPVRQKRNALCQKIISYVEKVKEPLVLRSAFEEGMYTQDPYIAKNSIQSVLCIPLIHKNLLFGILYLENNLTTDSFTEGRVEILQLLSSEIAIALDNATLYTNLAKTMHELEDYKTSLERKVDERTIELRRKKEELEYTLQQLHTTQKQVVQQEKLAALGFFTQGVAHEIQNPLNFVNNFSEIMLEQFDDLTQKFLEAKKTKHFHPLKEEVEAIYAISKKVNENSLRIKKVINMMLEHGKAIEGEYRVVQVNELLHQSSEIAYRDFLAKDPAFHVEIEENFDPTVKEIEGIPESLFRVFFNILHNALYAAYERKIATDEEVEPVVSITTREDGDSVTIRIRDNGQGIPEEIRGDIFTQFFTTKPPGTGTGLGLSLSYDSVIHEHQGELSINSSTEKGNTFTEVVIKLFHHLPLLAEKEISSPLITTKP